MKLELENIGTRISRAYRDNLMLARKTVLMGKAELSQNLIEELHNEDVKVGLKMNIKYIKINYSGRALGQQIKAPNGILE